ncbi:Hypothetical protein FKW44_003914 [Caligus rogercresseyi]|uniref:Uncharacterized protein n=1 Tax=Caligus rogercresseyi TaxID=217165 RepID=A0A7T8KMB0_CALRO|nr:Hypothetical protein FKW44_003914 [Caligus rogercresseyi]
MELLYKTKDRTPFEDEGGTLNEEGAGIWPFWREATDSRGSKALSVCVEVPSFGGIAKIE